MQSQPEVTIVKYTSPLGEPSFKSFKYYRPSSSNANKKRKVVPVLLKDIQCLWICRINTLPMADGVYLNNTGSVITSDPSVGHVLRKHGYDLAINGLSNATDMKHGDHVLVFTEHTYCFYKIVGKYNQAWCDLNSVEAKLVEELLKVKPLTKATFSTGGWVLMNICDIAEHVSDPLALSDLQSLCHRSSPFGMSSLPADKEVYLANLEKLKECMAYKFDTVKEIKNLQNLFNAILTELQDVKKAIKQLQMGG